MSEKQKKNYYGYTEAKKRANEKYNAKFREVKVRMLPERHEMVKKHAADHGESTSAFINRAIDEQIKRDSQQPAVPISFTISQFYKNPVHNPTSEHTAQRIVNHIIPLKQPSFKD